MQFIAHRINTIDELKIVPENLGVEVDLRDYGDRLILQHDPSKMARILKTISRSTTIERSS